MVRCISLLGFAILSITCVGADDPKPAEKGKGADEPLPKGAKVRFGTARMYFRHTTAVAFVPPDYKTFLAHDLSGGLRRYETSTGRQIDAGGAETPVGGQ